VSAPAAATGAPAAHAPRPIRGIALVVAAVCSFAVMEAMVKWLSRTYPVPLVVWARYFFHTVLMLALLWPRMRGRLVATSRPGLQLARGAVLGISSVFFFSGLALMPMADASALAAITPILVTVLATRLLHERPPPGTWWALAASFAGVLLIVRPGFSVFAWSALLPLASSFCYAGYQLLTRRLAGVDDGVATLFIGAAVATLMMTVFVPFFWRAPVDATDVLMFVTTGAIGGFGHLMLVRAFEEAPATVLAPFTYVHLVAALLLGLLVFGNFPDAFSLAGMALIVLTGLVMALRRRMPVVPVED
jgi:drug/metabolite transporter (DMT)-like permease